LAPYSRHLPAEGVRAVLDTGVSRQQVEDAFAICYAFNVTIRLANAFGFEVMTSAAFQAGAEHAQTGRPTNQVVGGRSEGAYRRAVRYRAGKIPASRGARRHRNYGLHRVRLCPREVIDTYAVVGVSRLLLRLPRGRSLEDAEAAIRANAPLCSRVGCVVEKKFQ
jgi:hypothetical protein